MSSQTDLELLIGGRWTKSETSEWQSYYDPAMGRPLGKVPFSTKEEVAKAADSAAAAFDAWRSTPMGVRVGLLFRLKQVMEDHSEELAELNTRNHGKTMEESRGDLRRTIENVDVAIAVAYTLSKGSNLDQIAPGIDEKASKEPLGVFAVVCPFNFPLMIPFWFLPYALVLGDTVVVKPSEITPLPMQRVATLIKEEVKLPPGVFNLVHGGSEVVEGLISNSAVRGVTFVGSTPVARKVFKLAGEHGKRSIVNGGAKNSLVVMPDADVERTLPSVVSSAFGNAGQRCLAGSNLIMVSDAKKKMLEKFGRASAALRVGPGLRPETEMGPVVSSRAKRRVVSYIEAGLEQGAKMLSDGRRVVVPEHPDGYYLGASVFVGVSPDMKIAKDEIFGPIASVMDVRTLDAALEVINKGTNFGNMASVFTTSGRTAREFSREARAGNIGVNIGVAAPAAYFPFGGMRDSFFGTTHPQIDTVDFFTDRKVTITRW
ncbi:MAG: CoA-acylating methylmalonate-semialdehyde dehydrogenase [Thaumarchaeota archaeon]|nr:CoA-acylating methylmalonate-semialdehyde dehydrogenase [Nitrososphaerota archaeon]